LTDSKRQTIINPCLRQAGYYLLYQRSISILRPFTFCVFAWSLFGERSEPSRNACKIITIVLKWRT